MDTPTLAACAGAALIAVASIAAVRRFTSANAQPAILIAGTVAVVMCLSFGFDRLKAAGEDPRTVFAVAAGMAVVGVLAYALLVVRARARAGE